MSTLTNVGRIFYSSAIAALGLVTIYYADFPYMMIPPRHSSVPGLAIISYFFGVILFLTGMCIALKKQVKLASLLLGSLLLLIFVFYFIPYQFLATATYTQLAAWENAEKELALCCGAFVIASGLTEKKADSWMLLRKSARLGAIFFSITMISFGILHFQLAKEVAEYVPSWVPFRLFWAYFAGAALIGSGLAIILNIKVELFAALLGLMIFAWVLMLHIPRVIVSPVAYLEGEITSTLIAFAYSGTAFVIAGQNRG